MNLNHIIQQYKKLQTLEEYFNYKFDPRIKRKLKRKAKYWTTGNFNKKNGYYSYAFRGADGTRQKNYVHRLVGLHFIKNPFPEEYNQINHIDGDKSNNIASNLEWVNTKKNMDKHTVPAH